MRPAWTQAGKKSESTQAKRTMLSDNIYDNRLSEKLYKRTFPCLENLQLFINNFSFIMTHFPRQLQLIRAMQLSIKQ